MDNLIKGPEHLIQDFESLGLTREQAIKAALKHSELIIPLLSIIDSEFNCEDELKTENNLIIQQLITTL